MVSCENCMNKIICKYSEKLNEYSKKINDLEVKEDIFTVTLKCKRYQENPLLSSRRVGF